MPDPNLVWVSESWYDQFKAHLDKHPRMKKAIEARVEQEGGYKNIGFDWGRRDGWVVPGLVVMTRRPDGYPIAGFQTDGEVIEMGPQFEEFRNKLNRKRKGRL